MNCVRRKNRQPLQPEHGGDEDGGDVIDEAQVGPPPAPLQPPVVLLPHQLLHAHDVAAAGVAALPRPTA